MNLTKYGIWTSYRAVGEENAVEAARLIQDLGFGAAWLGGSPEPDAMRPMLAATETLVVATGITNMWVTTPDVVAAQQGAIVSEYGIERALVGIGAGHPEATSDYTHPLRAMVEYLDQLDAEQPPLPPGQRVLAALGPKMLDLAGERSLGTHPYFTPVEHTRFCRERLGDGPLVAPEIACVIDGDAERARAAARQYAAMYLTLSNYTNNLLRFGFTEADIADGGSDRLIDAIVPQGSAQHIAEVVAAHLEAGADHVCVQTVGVAGVPREQWTALASALGL